MSEAKSETKSDTISEVSAEQLVAQRVDSLSQHMAQNRFDVIASIAVDALQKDGLVPVAAFLHATKAAFCNYEIAVRTMTQLQSQRKAADQARADAAFEHGKKMQAERKAEKLEADLAQSVLLVENQRLRLEEARHQAMPPQPSPMAKWCRRIRELEQKLETAEAALLEQQQRNEELVTQGSQQHMKIAELQRALQVDVVKTQAVPEPEPQPQAVQVCEGRWRTRGGAEVSVSALPTDHDDFAAAFPWWDGQESTWTHSGHLLSHGECLADLVTYLGPIEPQPQPAVQGGLVRDVTHYLEESGVLDLALSRGDDNGGN